jgi:hypothetical protein
MRPDYSGNPEKANVDTESPRGSKDALQQSRHV